MEQFYNIEIRQAMKRDGLESAKHIALTVKSTSEAEHNIVPLVYEKGAAILRMLHAYIGDGPFMAGFRLFLKKFANRNADKSDLWSCVRYEIELICFMIDKGRTTRSSLFYENVNKLDYK